MTQYHLYYQGLVKYRDEERLMTIYAISLLKPEIKYFDKGVLIDPSKLFSTRLEDSQPKLIERRLHSPSTQEDTDSEEEFKIGTVEDNKLDDPMQVGHSEITEDDLIEPFVPRDIPTCHFVQTDSSQIFLKMERANTCFLMIKSHQSYDVQMGINAGVWSSTVNGNKELQAAYHEFVTLRGGNVYLFFSVNKSGHICAFGELVSQKIDSVPDIWLEKQKYTGSFLVRFILVKDVPMNNFLHLCNAEGLPMKRCRDTDEIGFDEGLFMVNTCLSHFPCSSMLKDSKQVDFKYLQNEAESLYVKRLEESKISVQEEFKTSVKSASYHTPQKSNPDKVEVSKNCSDDDSSDKKSSKLSSGSKAYSPYKAIKGIELDMDTTDQQTRERFLKGFRSCNGISGKAKQIAMKSSDMCGKVLFSYGFYSKPDFFGLYNG